MIDEILIKGLFSQNYGRIFHFSAPHVSWHLDGWLITPNANNNTTHRDSNTEAPSESYD